LIYTVFSVGAKALSLIRGSFGVQIPYPVSLGELGPFPR
jgi:hypothetical protein